MTSEKIETRVSVFAIGANPITEEGEQFQVETNRWFPLWLYVTVTCEDLLVDLENFGFYPKHLKTVISENHAIEMAQRLLESVKNGKAKKYGDTSFLHDSSFIFSVAVVEEFANFCGLSGGFSVS